MPITPADRTFTFGFRLPSSRWLCTWFPAVTFDHAIAQVGPWLPTLRALLKTEEISETELVDVEDGKQHVRIRTHHGRLLIDVTEPGEDVHVACPLAMIEDLASELEAKSPAA